MKRGHQIPGKRMVGPTAGVDLLWIQREALFFLVPALHHTIIGAATAPGKIYLAIV